MAYRQHISISYVSVTGTGAVCEQKILVFVFQMGKSKTAWGWGEVG
jgi:hypothetical protein